MKVERLDLGRKKVIVGIRLDGYAKELLDWAVVKVADPGDSVVAIHVCRNSGYIPKEKVLLDGYLEDYEGLCNKKQVSLSAEVMKGNSIRKALVREAKTHGASTVIVGITRNSALGGRASIAKYCAKKLPLTIEVMAIHNGKVAFSRCSKISLEGVSLDPKASAYGNDSLSTRDTYSEFGESEISEMSRFSFDARDGNMSSRDDAMSPIGRLKRVSLSSIFSLPAEQRPGWPLLETVSSRDDSVSPIGRLQRGSLSSISLPAEDFTKQRPGWPLLQTSSSVTQLAVEARKMSVVQWVMTLPSRPLSDASSQSSSPMSCNTDDSLQGESPKVAEITRFCKEASLLELPKDLELILMRNQVGCTVFSLDFLKMSTSGFSSGNLIGRGGCNSVFKGVLPQGKEVAVKIMESSKEAWKDFIHEVDIMTTLNHTRIAPLLGICVEDDALISVYDLMPRGNLEENLHGSIREKENSVLLTWETRYRIAIGIAEALNHLHDECLRPVIHRDIKSSNILLTDELEPQLSDFGLAIWGPTTASCLMDSDVVGTFGYLAPEYFMYGKVSDKIDVYAFGVVLLELLSGRKPIGLETKTTNSQESLIMWAKPRLESKDLRSILDQNLENIDEDQMQRMALAAALCLTQSSRLRPKMHQILSILRGDEFLVGARPKCSDDDQENEDENDDEVYPDSSAESHLCLAFLDVNENSTSFSSIDQSSPLSVEEYLKKRWSRSSSMD
ncbi:LOW QUALITY PROTEIN: protein kinase STUNTED-like [Salvia miltiorrhiza]|uniref:LOW QUALITY PROTEIN: protein kinase STUNTED-like n=1 Tax=Salvia miltiorrhiza TaxID=226208 RepID=UPI0025ABD479|nr:LOW QUALITY PROTEIN: protein kinase STUNTED-like [Salvia miltiorrhiza]